LRYLQGQIRALMTLLQFSVADSFMHDVAPMLKAWHYIAHASSLSLAMTV